MIVGGSSAAGRSIDGSGFKGRRVAHSGLDVGAHGAALATATATSAWLPSARVWNRDAMDAIFMVLRTGMQWNALNATGICSSSSAHRRFQEWEQAGVFHEFWRKGLLEYDEVVGIDWDWLAADGAMGKAPLGGPKTGPNPTDRAKRAKRSVLTEAAGVPIGLAHEGANRHDQKLLAATIASIPIERPVPTEEQPQGICLDRAYDADTMRELVKGHGFTAHIRTRGEEIELKQRNPEWRALGAAVCTGPTVDA